MTPYPYLSYIFLEWPLSLPLSLSHLDSIHNRHERVCLFSNITLSVCPGFLVSLFLQILQAFYVLSIGLWSNLLHYLTQIPSHPCAVKRIQQSFFRYKFVGLQRVSHYRKTHLTGVQCKILSGQFTRFVMTRKVYMGGQPYEMNTIPLRHLVYIAINRIRIR